LSLQAVFDIQPYLTAWWMKVGYAALGFLFASLTLVYALASVA
jgi:hypothetical protein